MHSLGVAREDLMTAFGGFPPETIQFLGELRGNNRKDWFDAHRADAVTPAHTRTIWTSGSGRTTRAAPRARRSRPSGHWNALAPLHRWLTDNVQAP
jgi:hypothetical protein